MEKLTINHSIGYFCFGADNKKEAEQKYGLQIYFKRKPNWFRRFMFKLCFNAYWINS